MSAFRNSLLLAAALALTACGGTEVTMRNAQGAEVACKTGATSSGVTSDRVQDDLLTQCVDHYRFEGYEIASVKK